MKNFDYTEYDFKYNLDNLFKTANLENTSHTLADGLRDNYNFNCEGKLLLNKDTIDQILKKIQKETKSINQNNLNKFVENIIKDILEQESLQRHNIIFSINNINGDLNNGWYCSNKIQ